MRLWCQFRFTFAPKISQKSRFGGFLGRLGRMLGRLGNLLGHLGADLGRLAACKRLLGHVLGAPGAVWTGFGDPRTPERPPGEGAHPMEITGFGLVLQSWGSIYILDM